MELENHVEQKEMREALRGIEMDELDETMRDMVL